MLTLALFVLGFLISLSIHEAAHAYVADRLGDPTARLAGRVTLNPIVHLDPFGTLLPLILIFTGSPVIFGWGKPVPFDPFNLKNPRKDAAIISFSGPMANIAFAILLSLTIRLSFLISPAMALNLQALIVPIITLNVMWAVFNLIPIHPLDGGKVLVGLLPRETALRVDDFLSRYGFILILILLFPIFGFSPIFALIAPIINGILAILLPGTPPLF